MAAKGWSKTWTFFEDGWHEGNAPIIGARSHAAWLGSGVFDGARAFEGVTPDLDLHLARVNRSAEKMLLRPVLSVDDWRGFTEEGLKRFDRDAALYIRPMYWPEQGGPLSIAPDPASISWCLTLYDAPMPKPDGFSITLSPYKRPAPDTMPVEAKAGCLYPNNARALTEARAKGFDNCLLRDTLGNIAELSNSNIFMARDGAVYSPVPNGTFLDGITRQRVIALLREDGATVIEKTLRYEDFETADEIFATSNFTKVLPVIRIDERRMQPGPFYRKARELYWAFSHA